MEACYYADIPFDLNEEHYLYISKHGHEDKGEVEVIIPIRLKIGVTIALVGLFIMIVPIIPPPIKPYGGRMVGYGAAIAAEACYDCYDGNQNKKKIS